MKASRFRRYLSLGLHLPPRPTVPPASAEDEVSTPADGFDIEHPSEEIEIEVEGLPAASRFVLDWGRKPFLLVGRSQRCDVQLPHPQINPEHAYLQLLDGGVYCIDLESDLGVFWDSERMPCGWVHPGECVSLGPFALVHRDGRRGTPRPHQRWSNLLAETDLAATGARGARLKLLNARRDADGGAAWIVQRRISLIGSGMQCMPRLNHPCVSQFHCSLIAAGDGLWITDLHSRQGTWVNEERVHCRLLRQDDRIQVGPFQFAVDYDEDHSTVCVLDPPEEAAASVPKVRGPGTQDLQRRKRRRRAAGSSDRPRGPRNRDHKLILSLIDRFTGMQQQMFAMHHEQMMTMMQLMTGMNANYHETVKAELARINELTQQILELQETVAAGPRPGLPVETDSGNHVPELTETSPRCAAPVSLPEDDMTDSHRDFQTAGEPPVDATGETLPPPEGNGIRPAPRARETSHCEANGRLFERIDMLYRERSSVWRRLLRSLPGR